MDGTGTLPMKSLIRAGIQHEGMEVVRLEATSKAGPNGIAELNDQRIGGEWVDPTPRPKKKGCWEAARFF
jgi:hypothetical protein